MEPHELEEARIGKMRNREQYQRLVGKLIYLSTISTIS